VEVSDGYAIFPNPATDFIHVVPTRDFRLQRIELLNSTGQRILSSYVESEDSSPQEFWLPVRDIPEGIYSLILHDEMQHFFSRIMIQRH
jgi:hypothetical protein